jgi:hypothetical protein
MTYSNDDDVTIQTLVNNVHSAVSLDSATVSIRDNEGKFVYVNDIWLNDFKISPVGKTFAESGLGSDDEIARSDVMDDRVRQHGGIVEVSKRVTSNGQLRNMLVIRVFITYREQSYFIVVALNIGESYTAPKFGWSSDRSNRSFGEGIAYRLQMLDEKFSVGLAKNAMELQTLVEQLRAVLGKETNK